MEEPAWEIIVIDVAACYQTTMQAPQRGPQNARRVWHRLLHRYCPTPFLLLLAIGYSASPVTAFGADGGSYRSAVKTVWKVYQAATSSPYYRIAEELNKCYERFEKGQDGVIAAMNGQPMPAFGDGNFDADLAELENKVEALKIPDLQPIPAFPIGILGLSRDALRQEVRAGVGLVFAALSGAAAGNGFIDELQAEQDSINSFAAAIREYGKSLDPLLALGYLPVAQGIAFNVLDLQFHYPDNLSRIAYKVEEKKKKTKVLVAAYNRDAQKTIDYLLAALDTEDQLLQHDRQELEAKTKEEERLTALVADKIDLYSQADETSRKSDEELKRVKDEATTLNQSIIQSEAEVQSLSSDVNWKLQQAHNAYSLCPYRNSWEVCEHTDLKLHWMASNNPAPLAHRRALNHLDQARTQLLQMRQNRDDLRKRIPSLEKKAADDKREKEQAKQVWFTAAVAKNEYSAKLNAWKMETKIALYSSENEKARRDLVQARTEFN